MAVLWGTDGRIVGGTYCGRIRKFLARLFGTRPPQIQTQPLPDGMAPRVPPVQPPPTPRAPTETPPGPSSGPADRLEAIHKRLEGLAADLQESHRRLTGQEQSLGQRIQQALEAAASLRGRVEKAEAAVGSDNLRAVVRDVAAGVLADRAPGLAAKVLPAVLTALGWTGPPALAVIVAARVLAAVWKRRRARSAGKSRGAESSGPGPLNDEYADELARVFSLSGRSPLADATLGREYDEELRNAAESSDATLARWARALRDRVAQRFYRIHSQSPMPAEPLSSVKGAA